MTVGLLALGSLGLWAPAAFAVAPANDNFANAEALSGSPTSASGTNVGATKEANEPDHAGDPGGHSVWYSWQAPSSGPVTIGTCASSVDTLIGVYTGATVGGLTQVAANDESSGPNCADTDQSEVSFAATGGTTYKIAVDGWEGDTGSFSLAIAPLSPPPNDSFSSPEPLSGSPAFTFGTNAAATKQSGEPNHAGDPGGASVWYSWTAPRSGLVFMDTCNSDFDTLLGVYTGSAVNALTSVVSNDDGPDCGPQSEVSFTAIAGVSYRIAVDGSTQAGAQPAAFGQVGIELVMPPANDSFGSPQALPGSSSLFYSETTFGASKQVGEPSHAGNSGGSSRLVQLDGARGGNGQPRHLRQ